MLTALAASREARFHYLRNFLGVSFQDASRESSIRLESGPHCIGDDGQVSLGAVAMVADLALAISIGAVVASHGRRLATVSMHLQFTGAPMVGSLEARGAFEGFIEGTAARQGLARVALDAGGRRACFGTGAFMSLDPPPGVAMDPQSSGPYQEPEPLAEAELTPAESAMLAYAGAAFDRAGTNHSFIDAYWGYEPQRTQTGASCTMRNGPHVSNRVGHVQGGLLVGLAARTAMATLPATWSLASATACFVSPGVGESLHASAKLIHHGRDTAVARTEVMGMGGRKVLQVMTTHARRPA